MSKLLKVWSLINLQIHNPKSIYVPAAETIVRERHVIFFKISFVHCFWTTHSRRFFQSLKNISFVLKIIVDFPSISFVFSRNDRSVKSFKILFENIVRSVKNDRFFKIYWKVGKKIMVFSSSLERFKIFLITKTIAFYFSERSKSFANRSFFPERHDCSWKK